LKDLLDIIFRFPDKPDAGPPFVTSVLGLFTTPAIVVDRRMKVHLVNVQGQDMLFRLAGECQWQPGPKQMEQGRAVLPGSLRGPIRDCIKQRKTGCVCDFAAPGVRSDRYDLVLCPGEIQGAKFCFLMMLRPCGDLHCDAQTSLDALLESVNGCAAYLDRDGRFQRFNKRYLETFEIRPEEIQGFTIPERIPSKQATVLENQIKHLMAANEIRNTRADTLATAKKGIVVAAVRAWPLRGDDGESKGLVVLLQPGSRSVPLSLFDEKTKDLFGQASIEQGPPMFFTQVDGKVITMNAAAKGLLRDDVDERTLDLKTALPWVHPDLLSRLYSDILGGLNSSVFHTDVETADGRRVFEVQARGIREVGDIISTVLIHLRDVTEIEQSKNLLSQTVRRLATEREILSKVITGLQHARIAYTVVDRDLNVIRVSDSVLAAFKKGADYFIGKKAYEIDPSTRRSGVIAYLKTAMERGQSIPLEKFEYKLPGGKTVHLSLTFHPMTVDGQQACLLAVENLTEKEVREASLVQSSQRLRTLLENLQEGVAILDRNGTILDVSPVIYRAARMTREEMIGKNEREVMLVEEGDLLLDFRRRAMFTHQPVSTGCIKLTSKVRDGAVFADIAYIPLLTGEGAVRETLAVIRYLTDVVNLEKKVEEYTANLERLVRERTWELASANEELETTVGKLESMARSGLVLSSLKDVESVMNAFLVEAREVVGADFVSVALITSVAGSSKTTYYSTGTNPPSGAVPSDIIEKSLASLTLGGSLPSVQGPEMKGLLIQDFRFSDVRGLLLAWKGSGEFSAIDCNLSRLLCTQLGFALPVTSFVSDLRTERDRSRCLRRIAYRTAGSASVGSAIGVVAEELTKVMDADRFFWFLSKNGGDIWLSEVLLTHGAGLDCRKHIIGEETAGFAPVLEACGDSHRIFCDRFPDFGGEGFSLESHDQQVDACSFADPSSCDALIECLKGLLRGRGLIRRNEGSLAVAPVMLSRKSYGLLCAYNEMGVPFARDESCFMCLAASTVGHMWQVADASSSIRRLEAEGETLSELAHDLKYPLMRLRETLEKMMTAKAVTRKDLATVDEIDGEIGTLNRMVEEIIDISGRKERHPEILDVCEVINHCTSLIEQDAAGRSVTIRRVVDSIPPPAFANRKDVKTILINVLANCLEAAGADGWVNIAVVHRDSGSDGGAVDVMVTDSGPGVPEDLLNRVFDPFYTTKPRGGGVGLFSAKKRANANGGDVYCEIGEDGKSRFVISLPLAA
jgi:PAS domain S-box-containing protein